MKKEYESPIMNSLRYVFNEGIAANPPEIGDITIGISSLMPTP